MAGRRTRPGLPTEFFRFAVAASLTTGGLVTFGIIGYHLAADRLVPVAGVPVIYAMAMAVGAVSALSSSAGLRQGRCARAAGRAGPRGCRPPLTLSDSASIVVAGVVVWGLAAGVQDSAVKALVAELVPSPRRATAYGVIAGIQGAFAVVGGVVIGCSTRSRCLL